MSICAITNVKQEPNEEAVDTTAEDNSFDNPEFQTTDQKEVVVQRGLADSVSDHSIEENQITGDEEYDHIEGGKDDNNDSEDGFNNATNVAEITSDDHSLQGAYSKKDDGIKTIECSGCDYRTSGVKKMKRHRESTHNIIEEKIENLISVECPSGVSKG